jgi:hypothetical protein
MIYIVTQDGLNNYPVEDDDIIKTIVTTDSQIYNHCKYHISLEGAFKDKPYITLGDYKKEETAIKVIKEIATRRSAFCDINGWVSCYFMPKEDDNET